MMLACFRMIGGLRSDLEIENSGDFLYPGEPDLIAAFDTLNPAQFNSALQGNDAFAPSSFVDLQLGTIGDSPRTICCGPPIRNFDLSVFKDTSIGRARQIRVPC